MTAMELDTKKIALAQEILATNDAHILDEVEKVYKRAKARLAKAMKREEEEYRPRTKEEVLDSIAEAVRDLRAERNGIHTGKFRDAYELINEL